MNDRLCDSLEENLLMNCILKRFTAAAAMALAATGTQAEVLVSNLAQPERAFTELTSQFWTAQSFVTDGNSHSLLSIDAMLGASARRGGDTEFVAELHASGPAIIGSLLTTFSFGGAPSGAPAAIALLPDSGVTLAADTTYWLVMGERHGSLDTEYLGWSYAEGNVTTGPGSLGAFGFSTDGGLSWSASTFDTPNPFRLAVSVGPVAAVPEPSSMVLTALGLVALLAMRRLGGRAVQRTE
ncbi:MAG TPA: PEP-CTERM sorting domain-containing protein [Chloroflexota bacterium]|nr:PEP-CTERM sorting domain-containing protein [Chloroflexota bacterium]